MIVDIAGRLGIVPLKIVILHNIRAARKKQEHTYNCRQPNGANTTEASVFIAGTAQPAFVDAKSRQLPVEGKRLQRAADHLRLACDDAQISPRHRIRLAAALLPIAQRPGRNVNRSANSSSDSFSARRIVIVRGTRRISANRSSVRGCASGSASAAAMDLLIRERVNGAPIELGLTLWRFAHGSVICWRLRQLQAVSS